ncbi:FAD-dependent monooxygenase [Hymenobacter cellulosilyticus]|uniref:FAD-dependent monooxygenase n=1 Tax=Hymenobacter cellulosilyticus TaxID=2932248 RepID=A0A8T9Q1B3_9BACT|nr:FAD-dependent monooxygenase [Hymenobacter cellulosilyticus]UOQ70211.1 FAD-dependent monooxygenase [Hymenobacter cellulosilyticus]
MKSENEKKALVSGASIAGLATAYWLTKLGYHVTVVEQAPRPRLGGAALNIQGEALASVKRMGIFAQLQAHQLRLERWDFKNADDVTAGVMWLQNEGVPIADDDVEIERATLVTALLEAVQNQVEFLFNNRISALRETASAMHVTFNQGAPRTFDLVFGCDGLHSAVRQLWFGPEADYAHFMRHYFSLTTVNRPLIPQNTTQLYNAPGRLIMLNAYHGKTDIVFCFFSPNEIPYDYRNAEQQQQIVRDHFSGHGWRTAELLAEVKQADISYFDKLCQIKMPSWTKGRVALVGDAGYCASPAAGMGGSLALYGAVTVADALEKHHGNFDLAFQAYNQELRPFIEEVQATALTTLSDYLVPSTEEAIHTRNVQGVPL